MTTQPSLTPAAFAAKWRGVTTTEKASAQEHFIDLCRMLGEPTPHEADPIGAQFAFEKRVSKAAGGDGFADVWKRDFFAWEYKGRNKDLRAAYVQLMGYKDDLGNPPLLVVSDLDRIEIHTNFTGLSPIVRLLTLDDLAADDPSDALQLLRDVFTAPEELRPRIAPAQITELAARHVAEIAQSLRSRGHDPQRVAHFLDRILFCLFAEDAGLLPKGIFSRLSAASRGRSDVFTTALADLFAKMSKDGGLFGTEEIDWFNGGLFESGDVLPLIGSEIATLLEVSTLNWALIEPAIFGTLFERGLDPDQRAQLGAHYTDREAIWGLVEPVILRPLRRELAAMQVRVTELLLLRPQGHEVDPARGQPGGGLRRLPRATAARPRARPRLRLRQLPDRLAVGAQRPRVRGDPLGLGGPPALDADPPDRPGGGPGHRDQRLRRRARPGDHLDRRDPVDDPPRPGLPPRPDPQVAPPHRDPRRAAGPVRPGASRARPSGRRRSSSSGPAVSGRQVAAASFGDAYVEALFGVFAERSLRTPTSSRTGTRRPRARIARRITCRAGLLATQESPRGKTALSWSGSRRR